MTLSRFLFAFRVALATALALSAWTTLAAAQYIQSPGPSAALFAAPYYTCKTNYYVAATGSDSNNGTSSGTPWKTLQHANNSLPAGGAAAGSCINVAPGTYSGVSLTAGGNLASSTGYVVWRCTTMDACTINGTAGANNNSSFFGSRTTGAVNYVMVDGFSMVGNNSTYGVGANFGSAGVGHFGSHHIWVVNSIITGFGQAGLEFFGNDYTYAIHNLIYGNAAASNCDSGAQGSGLADNSALDIARGYPSYATTADDKTSPNSLIGSFIVGSSWFHKVYAWNVIHNNHLTPCSASGGDTDGNNIILDSFGTGNGNVVAYPDQTLIAFNVVYNAGGGGIHIFYSEYATVANNTCYNSGLDPYAGGTANTAACIDTNDSYGDTIINNIVVAIPAKPAGSCTFSAIIPGAGTFLSAILGGGVSGKPADTFSNNVTQLQGGHNSCWGSFGVDSPTGENPMWNADKYSCSSNKCATNPLWVSVGGTTTGTESTPPNGTNFALQPTSPAIGYGLHETYLYFQSIDAGACYHTLQVCP